MHTNNLLGILFIYLIFSLIVLNSTRILGENHYETFPSYRHSIFLGDEFQEYGHSMTIDDSSMYIVGTTTSTSFPTTENVYNNIKSKARNDLFLTKLSLDGLKLQFSTFIGPIDDFFDFDQFPNGRISIILDSENNIIIAGSTKYQNFPVSLNAIDSTHNGDFDIFLLKMSNDGSELIFSTFLGGDQFDDVTDIALDKDNNIYLAGTTASSNFPVTINSYDSTHNGAYDIFLSKFKADGSELLFSTFIGGTSGDLFPYIVLDSENNIVISGNTASIDYPLTLDAIDSELNGKNDHPRLGRDYRQLRI